MSPALDVLATPPAWRRARGPDMVVRERLIRTLLQTSATPLALLVAPAGYGKTTLLSQWAGRDPRPFAFVAVRDADNDAAHLLESIARALSQIAPIDDDVFIALSTPWGSSVPDVIARLERSIATCPRPWVLVLDDVALLHQPDSLAVLVTLAEHVPAGSQLALASRREPALPTARLRAQRRIVELRAPELSMSRREAESLLRLAGLHVARDEFLMLAGRAEGWPAGLALAGLAATRATDPPAAPGRLGGANRLVADYVRDEILATLPGEQTRFLMRTSILDVLSGPVCDAMLRRSGSGAMLRDLSRDNALLVALDHSDTEYRYHSLFAEMLRAELHRVEPDIELELESRASAWYARQGDLDRAVQHAIAAGDPAAAGRLLWASAPAHVLCGRTEQIRSRLDCFSDEELTGDPGLALTAAAIELMTGNRDLIEHWTAAAERALRLETAGHDVAEIYAGVAIMRAAVARRGLKQMNEDASTAHGLARVDSPWQSLSCLLSGVEAQLTGEPERARAHLQEGVRRGAVAAPAIQTLCLAQLALLALDEHDCGEAEVLSAHARLQVDRLGLGDHPLSALVSAVCARIGAERGRIDQAQEDRRTALRLLARSAGFAPWYEAETRIVLVEAAVRLGDPTAGGAMLVAAARAARELPEATVLWTWLEQARSAAETLARRLAEPASLTTAEMRVLHLLPTHLSFPEMASRQQVSANTIKTHALAVYRKLDACSRSEAVDRAQEAGLLAGWSGREALEPRLGRQGL